FQIEYGLQGNAPLQNAVVEAPLSADVALDPSADLAGGSYDAATHTVSWQIGTLQPNATGTIEVGVIVDNVGSTTSIENRARLRADGATTVSDMRRTTAVTAYPANLQMV